MEDSRIALKERCIRLSKTLQGHYRAQVDCQKHIIAECQHTLTMNPDDQDARHLLEHTIAERIFGIAFRYSQLACPNIRRKVIRLCQRSLHLNPSHHNARLLLGIVLSENGTPEEVHEGKQHFIQAIERAERIQDIFTNKWEEEDPVYQLAISEMLEGKHCSAAVLFVIDVLFADFPFAGTYIPDVLSHVDPHISSVVQMLIMRIQEEQVIPFKSDRVAGHDVSTSTGSAQMRTG